MESEVESEVELRSEEVESEVELGNLSEVELGNLLEVVSEVELGNLSEVELKVEFGNLSVLGTHESIGDWFGAGAVGSGLGSGTFARLEFR